jgi:glycosyltransferase involved in cell wall biosynthesis
MACGRPVLVSDIPGNQEWVRSGDNGWCFEDGNADSLAEGVVRAVEMRSHIPKMGRAARRIAEQRADWEKNFPLLLEGYQIALDEKRRKDLHRA